MFDLSDVRDLIRERINALEDHIDIDTNEGNTPGPEREEDVRRWRRALDLVQDASTRGA